MGSSRKHREKDRERDNNKDKYVSRSRSKSHEREKSERSHRSSRDSHRRERDVNKESNSSSRKRTRDSSDDEKNDKTISEKKLKVKDVSKHINSSINKSVKSEENNSADNEKQNKRESQRHKDKEDEVRTDGSNAEKSLSIEETNKLRLKLGLKPLQVNENDGTEKEDNETDATEIPKPKEIFVKTEKISAKIEAQKIKERIQTQRERRKILEKLKKTKTLAESDTEDEDTTSWILKSKQIQEQKAQALKREKVLQEMDEEFGVSSLIDEDIQRNRAKAYSSKHLKGLTVGHKTDAFKEGQQLVLTLKDKDVLDEDEDVLVNVNIVDDERAHINVENKLKRPEYKPYDEPEFDEFGILKKNTLLSKYDEEIEGPKKDSFKLGTNANNKANELEIIRLKLKQQSGQISLVLPEPKIANEYYTEEEMTKFKKPKKIRKTLRKVKKEVDSDVIKPLSEDILSSDHGSRKSKAMNQSNDLVDIQTQNVIAFDSMDVDNVGLDKKEILDPEEDLSSIVLEEDEAEKELQLALHKARKLKQRENVCTTTGAASIVKVAETVRLMSDVNNGYENNSESNGLELPVSANIILNSTAEFCRNLGDIPTYGMAGNRDEDEDLVEFERELIEERNKLNNELEPNRGTWNEVEMKEENAEEIDDNEGQPILEEEPDVSVGLAGALKLAMKKGYLDKEIKKQVGAQRHSLLEAQSYTIEEKFYEDDKVGRRERYNGPVSEFREKDTYRPEIKLDYVDEKGRVLDQKEAFRHLSHKFHGKGPGKNKIDKRMKKKDQESKLRQMSSTDTPLNTLKMLQEKQKELQSPFIILTGGQKTSIQTTISKTK